MAHRCRTPYLASSSRIGCTHHRRRCESSSTWTSRTPRPVATRRRRRRKRQPAAGRVKRTRSRRNSRNTACVWSSASSWPKGVLGTIYGLPTILSFGYVKLLNCSRNCGVAHRLFCLEALHLQRKRLYIKANPPISIFLVATLLLHHIRNCSFWVNMLQYMGCLLCKWESGKLQLQVVGACKYGSCDFFPFSSCTNYQFSDSIMFF